MVRRIVTAVLLASVTAGGMVALAVDPPFDQYPVGKGGKQKKEKGAKGDRDREKAEKWAMKLQSADPEAAERWMAEKMAKEQMKAEKSFFKAAEKEFKSKGFVPDPPAEGKPDPKPSVLRYGTLPKEVPNWWAELDTDKDVQISLFEWRTAGRAVDAFVALDLNNDGLLTVEEYFRAVKMQAEDEPKRK